MTHEHDVFEEEGLERLLARAEVDPTASEELDLVVDLVAAAELERARLARPAPAVPRALARPWIFAAAASLLFLLALGAWLLRDRGARPEALAALAPPRFVAAELRDPDATRDEAFLHAMEAYQRGDWAAAADALARILAEREHGPSRFYLAAALEQLGELARAGAEYERAAGAPDALLADDARFRLAHLWLRTGEVERARVVLGALARGGGELARNARELLDALAR